MKKLILSLIISLFPIPVLAQVPIDPLRLPDSEAGSYIYTFGIGYSPSGIERDFVDFFGDPARLTLTENSLNLSFSGGYSFNKNLSIYANVIPSLFVREEKQQFINESITTRRSETDITGSLALEYRFAPQAVLDPRLSVAVSYPLGINVQTSATLLKDPVVLLGSLGYNKSFELEEDSIAFGIGAGFIANEYINFSATASHSFPLETASLSTTSLSFRTGYNLDQKGGSELGFKTTLSVRGEDTRVGFSVEYGGRGRIGNIVNDSDNNINNNQNNQTENTSPNTPSSPNTNTLNTNTQNSESQPQQQLPTKPSENNSNLAQSSINSTNNQNLEKSVQELYLRLEEKDRQIQELQQKINNLEKKVELKHELTLAPF
ncbi:MAG: hypothetical protein EAZ76_02235 [Nostocales cyanobacterium]|nr:MAG: hypothetical protein EAZ87_10675 [Nostocales cyanobacterium]TAF20154.1 MAG: hypothetical protein EAZ76_02235 [Nostocales cyanobacterium]